ncbi:biosynthetic peptidoglycan transglycosylase [Mesorhizobium denitrificans]|uniref:Glycosyl transferase family 51 domain-containing protein n=1 Tax=Mesorhizobium denitrificans TaxID=2294114 RepID=A0A371XH58_9HYPH|nr:hypothetical protein DY251_06205 [Mesorhizobium denitrificans]
MLRFRNQPLRLPSLKRFLIGIYGDLHLLDNAIQDTRCDSYINLYRYVLVLEDRRYYSHKGIDYISFLRDFWRLVTLRRHGGFSTIEMQLVRTVTARYERTLSRKLYEILLAHLCNWHFSKRDMLLCYCSIAYYGARYPVQHYGGLMPNCEAVAFNEFGKSLGELTEEDAAEIASYLVYPRPTHPTPLWLKKVDKRKRYALKLAPSYKYLFEYIPI